MIDVPRDPVSGNFKGAIISYKEDDGRQVFLLKKNQKKYLKATADICVHCKNPLFKAVNLAVNMFNWKVAKRCIQNAGKKFKKRMPIDVYSVRNL